MPIATANRVVKPTHLKGYEDPAEFCKNLEQFLRYVDIYREQGGEFGDIKVMHLLDPTIIHRKVMKYTTMRYNPRGNPMHLEDANNILVEGNRLLYQDGEKRLLDLQRTPAEVHAYLVFFGTRKGQKDRADRLLKNHRDAHGPSFAQITRRDVRKILLKLRSYAVYVTGHQSNTLDNQCGTTITDSSVSGASLPLANVQRKVNN